MPGKSRTPPPPRRVQAPKTRTGGTRTPGDGPNRNLLYALAASGVVALAAVIAFLVLAGGGGSSSKGVASAFDTPGCTYKTYKALPRTHLTSLPPKKKPKYNSFPPSSGPHYIQTVVYDFYDQPVDEYMVIHNLEHGAIVVQWGDKVPASQVDEIRAWYRDSPDGMVGAPLPKLGNKIAIIAWTHLAKCTRFDEDAFSKFRDAFRFKGPEKIPPDTMTPGGT